MTLWGDIYFYISAFGFAASCALFGFFLRQYRLAVQAADEHEADPAELPQLVPLTAKPPAEPEVALPVAKPEPEPRVKPVRVSAVSDDASAAARLPSAAPAPSAQAPAAASAVRPKSETTLPGGISPAIVYLQSVKSQLEILEKEVANLKGLASKQSSQEELILKKLSDISEQIKAVKAVPAAQPRPAASATANAVPEGGRDLALQNPGRPGPPGLTASSPQGPAQAAAPVSPAPARPAQRPPAPGPSAQAAPITLSPLPAAPATTPPDAAPPASAPAEAAPAPLAQEQAPAAAASGSDENTELQSPPAIVLENIPQAETPAESKPSRRGPVWPV
ncbi:MAG: hypothetical protein HY748_13190 [Elusimicrobia bacterium]|nr:hypothetical protein [Elusimicrobiota bacterium]